jgi:hypothetical protein
MEHAKRRQGSCPCVACKLLGLLSTPADMLHRAASIVFAMEAGRSLVLRQQAKLHAFCMVLRAPVQLMASLCS